MTGPSYLIAKNGATTDIRIRDVFEALAEIPDGTIDLVLTSPPFLALRSYLPADHPDKAKEIGSEANPAEFIDTLLRLSAEWRRVLAPHGSICVELGDTYSGNNESGFHRSGNRPEHPYRQTGTIASSGSRVMSDAWPLDKSMCGIPHLYHLSLAYGRNLLTGQPSPAGQWRVRNVVAWCLDGDTVVYARTPKGQGPTRLLHLAQNWQPGQWELWDGSRWTKVLGWSTREADDAIEIEFRNGEIISATRNHEWPTQRGLVRTDELTVGDIVPHVRLPEPERVAPSNLPDEDIGYIVGLFLADGSFDSRDRIQFSGHRDEATLRLATLRRIAESYDGTATAHDVGQGHESTVIVRSPILAAVIRRYVAGTSARNKALRPAAWRRSNQFLGAVLDGYLSGDGHYDAKNERWRLGFTDNRWLARDIRVLCARLGYRCRIKRFHRAADPRGGRFAGTARFYYRGEIRTEMTRDLAPMGEVIALRKSKRRRFYDVGVDGEPHLFALGSGLLTHNCRPNPPVGALGDKVRPATSYMTMACISRTRYFDLDAVREQHKHGSATATGSYSHGDASGARRKGGDDVHGDTVRTINLNPAGAPPLDWWEIPTEPYSGAHYACWPKALLTRPILAMCPEKVCTVCGEPSRRIVGDTGAVGRPVVSKGGTREERNGRATVHQATGAHLDCADRVTIGWTDCGCSTDGSHWRRGVVLDPFGGSGTTAVVASRHGRDCIMIDLDPRNLELMRERLDDDALLVERETAQGLPSLFDWSES